MSSKGSEKVKNIAIFASGTGSNTLKIIQRFAQHTFIHVALIVSNKTDADVLIIAHTHHIPTLVLEKDKFYKNAYLNEFQQKDIDFIVLAGFLWKIPSLLIDAYPNKIINIHPALLPAYGGKGMYGHHVHEAVIAAKEKQSGITIHYVDEKYDHGSTIFQVTCDIEEKDTPETLAQKIHVLEHQHFPVIIEKILTN